MPTYGQNTHYPKDQVPSYYVNNRTYGKGAYTRTDWPTRTSRRLHEGLNIMQNYGLDTTSDDVDSSPYSSPYYINGRYNSANSTTQRGNSSSVQGVKRLTSIGDIIEDFTEDNIETTLELWQGKQIKFEVPYSGKVVGNTITLKNTGSCQGMLSIYFSARENGPVIAETAIDLCTVSPDNFEHRKLYMMTPILRTANPRGKLYVRMEIYDDLKCKHSTNPFNTGRKIEIAATGHYNHKSAVNILGDKNTPIKEKWDYQPYPSAPCLGLIYNNLVSVPTVRIEGVDYGATVTNNNFSYDIFCYKDESQAYIVAYDRQTNRVIDTDLPVSGDIKELRIVQAEEYMYYVDGHSPLRRVEVGNWNNVYTFPLTSMDSVKVSINADTWVASGIAKDSGTFLFTYDGASWSYKDNVVDLSTYGISVTGTPVDSGEIKVTYIAATETTAIDLKAEYYDARPVLGASIITRHNNRIYLAGFEGDPNLVQESRITASGPDFNSFPYRFYVPDRSPRETSTNPITAIVEIQSDELMITLHNGYTRYTSNVNLEDAIPTQVSSYSDGAGVASSGDIVSYRGHVYSFDPDEGIRRWNGALWERLGGMEIDTLFERVDMTKPRKLWGYAYKLYFNYTDKLDGKAKCIIWDQRMSWQQFPFFQDSDLPFCDVRANDDFDLIGIHPDYPCIMRLYAEDTWHRLDTPIVFERWTKYLSLPGNASDLILRRVHAKVLANINRIWYFGISVNEHNQKQVRGKTITCRIPSWGTEEAETQVEDPFNTITAYSEKAVDLLTLPSFWNRAISVQIKTRCKTFRAQANLISILGEARTRQYQ